MPIPWFLFPALIFLGLVVLTQDIHIFPAAFSSLFNRFRPPVPLPGRVERSVVSTSDDKQLELWRLPPLESAVPQPFVALVFHGNGGTLNEFLFPQSWFAELGIVSYGFDYRGFGRSTGWPSEKGIYLDSDTVWDYVVQREQVSPSQIIVCGLSLGCTPAARIASLHAPRVLLLVSPFIDLKTVAREQPLVGFLAPLLWHQFPTLEYVQQLNETSLILVHGDKDTTVRPYHSAVLQEAYQGTGNVLRLTSPESDHDTVFSSMHRQMMEALVAACQGPTIPL